MADFTGYNFSLPGTQGYQQGQGYLGVSQPEQEAAQATFAPATGQAVLPNIQQDIAQIEGITNEYYDSYGKIKSFVEDMNRKGIDVTKPDYSQPGGGVMFQTYKKLEANVMNTANTLKNELSYRNKMNDLEAQGKVRMLQGVDPRTQTLSTQDSYYSTNLFDEVTNLNNKMKDAIYTGGDLTRYQAARTNLKNQLQSQLSDPNLSAPQRAQIENNIRALAEPIQTTNPYATRPASAAAQGQENNKEAALAYYKQVANILGGVGEFAKTVDKDLSISQVNRALADIPMGMSPEITVKGQKVSYPKILEAIVKKGDKTYLRFMQPDKLNMAGKIPDGVPVAGGDILPDEEWNGTAAKLVERIIKENKGALGFDTADLLSALKDNSLLDAKTNQALDEKVIDKPNAVKPISATALKDAVAVMNKELTTTKSKEAITKEVNGQLIKVIKNKPFFYGDTTYSITVDGEPVASDLTLDKVAPTLQTKTTFFNDVLDTTPSTVGEDSMVSVELNGKVGQIPKAQLDAFLKKYPNATTK